jgi:hypothetical protein
LDLKVRGLGAADGDASGDVAAADAALTATVVGVNMPATKPPATADAVTTAPAAASLNRFTWTSLVRRTTLQAGP